MARTELGAWFIQMMMRKGRIRQDLTQREIAEEVHIATDTYRAYEAGRSCPTPASIKALAKACGISDEIAEYMVNVAVARRKGHAIEADTRFNTLFIALAEAHYGFFFKFDASMIPGPLQLQEYHYIVVRLSEPLATEHFLDGGWKFKDERQQTIEARTDRPVMQFLIGETALLQLRAISEELYQDQMAHLRRWARRPGVFIRVLRGPVPAQRSNFSIYMEGESDLAGPSIAYTETIDSSWVIDDSLRIARYDEFRKALWKKAIRIEVYHDDDRRDRLA
ncbi:Scr1 family TA system antitoxin-like transcriptional regulator [Glycomyces rhizosphaerae]|uniref:Scr1 family TA system antitoxin-like transcriptional regulator n=1 Tax=Glycomyces rhizosphaerae TaxID=2054422 RepID=A0ABV7Q110_9ACTN